MDRIANTPPLPSPIADATASTNTGSFNHRTAKGVVPAPKCVFDALDPDDRLPLAESIAMMQEVGLLAFVRPTTELLSPGAAERVRQACDAYRNRGLIHDPLIASIINEFDKDISADARKNLALQIRAAACAKHDAGIDNALTYINSQTTSPLIVTPILERAEQALIKGIENMNIAYRVGGSAAIKQHLGNLDLLLTLITDFVYLLQQKTCVENLSPARFINLTSFARAELAVDRKINIISQGNAAGCRSGADFYYVVATAVYYPSISDDRSIVRLVKDVCAYWEEGLEVCVSITKSSATALKSYLNSLGIDRLYFPMANSGYFARMIMDAGMPVTCSDVAPKATFTKVKKVEISPGIQQFFKALATANQSTAATALALCAPPATFFNMGTRETVGEFLPKVAKVWFTQGGRYVLVISDMVDIDTLFNPKALSTFSISLEPISPGFTPDIYLGLGVCIGTCGVYRIHGADCQWQSKPL